MVNESQRWVLYAGALVGALWAGLPCAAAENESQPQAAPVSETAASPAEGPQKIRLVYRFIPNQVVRYDVSHEMEITTQFSETTEVARNKSEARKNYRVVGVNADGSGELELMLDWVRMTAKLGDADVGVEFISDNPQFHSPKFKHILETVGKPQAVIRFSPTGAPLQVTANKPLEAVQPGAGGADASPESYLPLFPAEAVAVGETWKERYDITARTSDKLPIKVEMLRVYQVSKIQDGRAEIDFKTTILTPIHDPTVSAQLIQRETAGKMVFDMAQGLIVSRDVVVDRTVINPFGSKSSMRAVSKYRERLIKAEIVAQRTAGDRSPAPAN